MSDKENINEDNPAAEPVKVGNKVLRWNKEDKKVEGIVTKVLPSKVHVKYGSNTVEHHPDDFDTVHQDHSSRDYKRGFRHYTYHSNDGINEGYENTELKLDEASIAAATLRAGSRTEADPKSKIEFMQRTLGAMNGMKKEDLTKWFDQAMALIGKEADSLPSGANSGANQNSIDMKTGKSPKTRDAMPKLSVKEDVEEMFEGQDLSEEFKENASTIFEAAVTARAALEIARLDEEYEIRLEESVTELKEELQANLDSYLSYVTEKWMKENQVAIESALRNEIMEEFIDGLKGLFVEHYIDIPEEKVSVVESLAAKVEALESALDESITENAELKSMVLESNKQEVLDELAEGLTMSQAEKFFALAEGVHFDGNLDVYAKKLSVVKENYFTKKLATVTNLEEETFETGDVLHSGSVDPSVNRYVQAISRTVKK
jgi:hypothetical protein